MKKYAIIVAAGSGNRMGNPLPKQFLPLLGKPLLTYTVEAFVAAYPDINLCVVMHPDHIQLARQLLSPYPDTLVVPGGSTRFASVKAGLEHVEDESIVFVHDGVRCLATGSLIRRCYAHAMASGNAVPAIPAVDSLRMVGHDGNEWLDRSRVRIIQTPQTFQAPMLKRAYQLAKGEDFTDDALVAERAGEIIHLVDGEVTNIKVTYPTDLVLAETILRGRGTTF